MSGTSDVVRGSRFDQEGAASRTATYWSILDYTSNLTSRTVISIYGCTILYVSSCKTRITTLPD
jgi:hypothetical protein